ncbi:hypothetical protein J6590_006312 [Homalodisca vitripennis]|nr:hypothetical protein J6590_006312 [Homalodisca vitripennis]
MEKEQISQIKPLFQGTEIEQLHYIANRDVQLCSEEENYICPNLYLRGSTSESILTGRKLKISECLPRHANQIRNRRENAVYRYFLQLSHIQLTPEDKPGLPWIPIKDIPPETAHSAHKDG